MRSRWQALGPWGQAAVVAWAIAFLAISIRVCLSKPRTHSDYLTFANTARNWVAGNGIYRQCDQTGFFDDFRYSPLVACSLVPFSILPDRAGNIVWRLVNLAVFAAALGWWAKRVLAPQPSRKQLALLFLLVLPLSIGNINNAQSNPLVLGFLLAAVAVATESRWNLCSVFIAGAVLFKLYPIAVGLLLVAIYPRQLGVRMTLAILAGLALPFLLQKPAYVAEQYRIWFDYLVAEDRQMLPLAATYRDVRLLFRALSTPLSAHAYLLLQLGTAAGAALVCLWGRWAGWAQPRLLTLLTGLGCIWMTVFGVATESCTYMLVAPTAAWALMQARLGNRGWLVQALVGVGFGLFLIAQVANWFRGVADFHALGIQPFAGLLLLLGLLAAEVRRPVAQDQNTPLPLPQARAA